MRVDGWTILGGVLFGGIAALLWLMIWGRMRLDGYDDDCPGGHV